MKYMTFNSSCSYAGLANLLSFHGVDTEDRKIALEMELPYLFACEDGYYLSGPMLQGAKWFNLYLNPIGLAFSERVFDKEEVCAHLRSSGPSMLGLRVSPKSKHAVVFTGQKNGSYHFLNNKRMDSSEPDELDLTEEELLARLEESVVIGCLERTAPADRRPDLEASVRVLEKLMLEAADFCTAGQSIAALQNAMNSMFRSILVDGVTMLELLGEMETAAMLRKVRAQFLDVIRAGHSECLEQVLDMPKLIGSIVYYEHLVTERIKKDII